MKNLFLSLVIICLVSLWADNIEDPLWQKAEQIASENWNWVPGVLEVEISALTEDGDEMMTSSLMFSYENEDGAIAAYYDGGKRNDSLIPENDQMVQQFLAQDMTPQKQSLFFENQDWELQVTNTGRSEKKNKCLCTVFEYTCQQPGENGQKIPTSGSVWLDSDSGAPIYNEQTLHPPVDMIEEIVNKITYDSKNANATPTKMETVTSVNAMGQKAKMLNKIKFKKYWRYDKED
jgi:hypothetical protein